MISNRSCQRRTSRVSSQSGTPTLPLPESHPTSTGKTFGRGGRTARRVPRVGPCADVVHEVCRTRDLWCRNDKEVGRQETGSTLPPRTKGDDQEVKGTITSRTYIIPDDTHAGRSSSQTTLVSGCTSSQTTLVPDVHHPRRPSRGRTSSQTTLASRHKRHQKDRRFSSVGTVETPRTTVLYVEKQRVLEGDSEKNLYEVYLTISATVRAVKRAILHIRKQV